MTISAGLVGVGGALSGLFGGSSVPQYSPYINPSQVAAPVGSALGSAGGLSSQGAILQNYALGPLTGFYPTAQSATGALTNNPYGPQYQGAAGAASSLGTNAAIQGYNGGLNAITTGQGLLTAGSNLIPAGDNLLPVGRSLFPVGANWIQNANMLPGMAESLIPGAFALQQLGLDPQSALYNQQVNNLTQQIDVANAQAGLSTSPYGTSVLANALGNFNINWQNNQLQRAIAGEQGMAGMLNTAGGLIGTGANIASTGAGIYGTGAGIEQTGAGIVNTGAGITSTGTGEIGQGSQIAGTSPLSYLQSAGLPYSTFQGINQDVLNNIGLYGSTVGGLGSLAGTFDQPTQTAIQDYLAASGAYNAINQNAVQAYQAQVGAQGQQFAQNQLLGSALGRGLGMIGGAGGTGTGGNAWSGLNFNSSPLWSQASGLSSFFNSI
jgi:hypothetical protein